MSARVITAKDRLEEFDRISINELRSQISEQFREYLISHGFFVKPAAISHHGNYTGGLFDHSYEVMDNLVGMTDKLGIQWQNSRSPYIVGMFHDICKMDDYIDKKAEGIGMMGTGEPVTSHPEWIKNPDCILTGHGSKSVMMLSQFINLTEEEMLCIRFHMGAYETDQWEQYGAAIKKYETVLWTHTADMYASKVSGV